jgi:transcriptional regulator with XRE-family HTH domain
MKAKTDALKTSTTNPFKAFGAFLKQMRINTGFTLQRFCAEFGYDTQNQSKLERGLASPPMADKNLSKLANDLCLWEGMNEWDRLFDLAEACKGKLPPPGLSDDELVEQLPLVFRTVNGKRLSEDKLMEFAHSFRSF